MRKTPFQTSERQRRRRKEFASRSVAGCPLVDRFMSSLLKWTRVAKAAWIVLYGFCNIQSFVLNDS